MRCLLYTCTEMLLVLPKSWRSLLAIVAELQGAGSNFRGRKVRLRIEARSISKELKVAWWHDSIVATPSIEVDVGRNKPGKSRRIKVIFKDSSEGCYNPQLGGGRLDHRWPRSSRRTEWLRNRAGFIATVWVHVSPH